MTIGSEIIPVPTAEAAISRARLAGVDAETDQPLLEPDNGPMVPRFCMFAGSGACKNVCQAPADYDNTAKDCVQRNGETFFDELGVDKEDVYLAVVSGSATVAFVDDRPETGRNTEGYRSYAKTDGLFGYADTVKACRLADCGMLVVTDEAEDGRAFSGFIHATRNNMTGDDQFEGADGKKLGGVEYMLRQVREHYGPTAISLRLVAGIAPHNYVWDFTPSESEHEQGITAEAKRERTFKDWAANGWIKPQFDTDGNPTGKYEADMAAAIRHQVARAGLMDTYNEDIHVNGDPENGHASNRAGKAGIVPEARDVYAVIPEGYRQ